MQFDTQTDIMLPADYENSGQDAAPGQKNAHFMTRTCEGCNAALPLQVAA
jgi:hypothetical protein